MKDQADYRRVIEVTASHEMAYDAVTRGFADWWTDAGGSLATPDDVASFRFPPNKTSWTFRPITLRRHSLVEHECIEADHIHEGLSERIREEWLGSTMRFEIAPSQDGSRITFTHKGLNPNLECFDVCKGAWDFFFLESLKTYLNTGKGSPHRFQS